MLSEFRIAKLHHIGIAVESVKKGSEFYRDILGIKLTTGIIVDELQKVKVAFAGLGNGVSVEFVEPLGSDSPVSRIIQQGGGLYHVCYMVSDIEKAVQHARDAGALVISLPQPAKAFADKRVAFIYMPDRSVVEFLEE